MDTDLSSGLLGMAYILAVASLIICIVQIVLRKKLNLISACKASVFLPLISIIVKATSSISQAFITISRANDLSASIIDNGLAVLFQSISMGLIITIVLLIFYAITKTVYDNTVDKK